MQTTQKFQRIIKIIFFLLMCLPMVTKAQTEYQLSPLCDNLIKVVGISNARDWYTITKQIESNGTFKFNSQGELSEVTALNFTVMARSLKSGKPSMDALNFKMIKGLEFPKITYQLTFATVTMIQANRYLIQTTGNLKIAGKIQSFSMNIIALVNADRSISCHGDEKIMLTDFGVDPKNVAASLKVENNLLVHFEVDYIKTSLAK